MPVDVHCHIAEYTATDLDALLARARAKGVTELVGNGVTLNNSRKTVAISQAHEGMWAAVGMHPWYIQPVDEKTYQEFKELSRQPKVAFIGEIGLDLNRDPATIDVQKQAFEQLIRLALEVNLPLNIHCRLADKVLIDILGAVGLPDPPGLIHGFKGDLATLRTYVDMGFHISFGRPVLNNEPELWEAVRWLPLERLLLETDSSVRWRELGEPALVSDLAERVAAIRETSTEAIRDAVASNFRHLVG